jgi:hypothetical protein
MPKVENAERAVWANSSGMAARVSNTGKKRLQAGIERGNFIVYGLFRLV